ncbi:MAG: HPr family phosphocarrier protein [Hespellia sp.]|jgi:phosphocarrier protein HPr|nr:HPr family phosphocarrier protein [Hespellia sp.]
MLTEKITICNPSGLHARPASQFVYIAGLFQSSIFFRKVGDDTLYNAKSILSVLTACVKFQMEIELQINGPDEEAAFRTICAAVENGFGEAIKDHPP